MAARNRAVAVAAEGLERQECGPRVDPERRGVACTLYARAGRLADPVYVHAKIGIIDDSWLTLGSANLNEHSLFNDTEVNLVLHPRGR